jgi:Gas vesicle synthesis protein GvpL/GvpF
VSLHVYALATHPAVLPAHGLEGAPVQAVALDGVDVVVSPVPDGAAETVTETAVLEHARVVDEVFEANDAVLPARYGHGFADAAALEAAVGGRLGALREGLERVRGMVELGLRVTAPAREERASASSGRDYLAARRAELRAAEDAAQTIHEPLAGAAAAATVNVLATAELLLSAAYLVPRAEVERFLGLVEATTAVHPELTFACTGPWPPYSFAILDVT